MSYIGREPQIGNFQMCDAISVVNNQAAYTMQVGGVAVIPGGNFNVIASVNGSIQKAGTSFTISSSTITFSQNLVTGDVIDFILILGSVLDLGVPSDGTVTTGKIADNAVTSAKLASGLALGKIGQVVSTTKTDTATISSSGFADVSGLTLNITPSATSSKVLIKCNITLNHNDQNHTVVFRFLRGSTAVGVGASAGNRLQASAATATVGGGDHPQTVYAEFLDSPSSSSQVVYKIQIANQDGAEVMVNRNNNADTDNANANFSRYASTITAMEVLA
mgnify:FL=1